MIDTASRNNPDVGFGDNYKYTNSVELYSTLCTSGGRLDQPRAVCRQLEKKRTRVRQDLLEISIAPIYVFAWPKWGLRNRWIRSQNRCIRFGLAAGPRAVRERAAGQTGTKLIQFNCILVFILWRRGFFDQFPSTKSQSIERSTYLESFEPPFSKSHNRTLH